VAEAFDYPKRDGIQRTQGVVVASVRRTGWIEAKPLPWVGSYHRNDRHGEQRRPEPKPLLLGIGL
jgi:hypothetical protein